MYTAMPAMVMFDGQSLTKPRKIVDKT